MAQVFKLLAVLATTNPVSPMLAVAARGSPRPVSKACRQFLIKAFGRRLTLPV